MSKEEKEVEKYQKKIETAAREVEKVAKDVKKREEALKKDEIRLEKQVKKLGEKGKEGVKGFLDFIKSYGVIGLAVGLVIGTAASTLVNSLINNVVMPPLGFLLGSADGLRGLAWNMGVTPSGEDAVLHYGQFLADFVNFLVIAVVIYMVVKWLHVEIKKK